jgi:hypothetical protein
MLNFYRPFFIPYFGSLPDIEKFLPVAIFKMAATIPHKFNTVRFQRPELIPDIGKFLPVSIFKMVAMKVIPETCHARPLIPETCHVRPLN